MEYNADACYKLIGACVEYAISPPITSEISKKDPVNQINALARRRRRIRETRVKFSNSPILKVWCDLANIDYNRTRKAILKYNGYVE